MSTVAGSLLITALSALPSMQSICVLAQTEVIDDPEAYAVYAAVLPIRFGSGDTPLFSVTLLQETRAVADCPREEDIQPQWRLVVESYRKENSRVRILQPGFELGVPYDLITVEALRTLMRGAGYDFSKLPISNSVGSEVFRRFPGGRLFTVSAVGFDSEKTRAMVTLQRDCFPSLSISTQNQHCHTGRQLLLEKQDGRWVQAKGVGGGCGWVA
jgi:hypothetical protein